jgi:hypothetical protein
LPAVSRRFGVGDHANFSDLFIEFCDVSITRRHRAAA